jgi:general secretion pathway protein M
MNTSLSSLRAWWASLSGRERRAMVLAGSLVLVALIWLLMLGPALKVLRSAPQQHRVVDEQLSRQQAWHQEAQELKSRPRMAQADAQMALQASVKAQLGAAGQLTVSGDRATLTVKSVNPAVLAQWLNAARTGAHSKPLDAQLTQQNGSWSGTLVMQLPPNEAR